MTLPVLPQQRILIEILVDTLRQSRLRERTLNVLAVMIHSADDEEKKDCLTASKDGHGALSCVDTSHNGAHFTPPLSSLASCQCRL